MDINENETVNESINELEQRKLKLDSIRKDSKPFPNDFKKENYANELYTKYDSKTKEELESEEPKKVIIAGRIRLQRWMGKASFMHVQDETGQIQIYLRKSDLPEGVFEIAKTWDIGDIVGLSGTIFKTKTGELSVKASEIKLLTKSLRPLPDKFHGLHDQEMRYRQRYVDLIVNDKSREVFKTRIKLIQLIRDFLNQKNYLEVETPMMQAVQGGAIARPFKTHHNALDMDLFLRIAPELYLKRLIVGGFEKVYEINRNFRNEGLSTQHNPEFTMIEFYQAYSDYKDLINLTEELFKKLSKELCNDNVIYQGQKIELSKPFAKLTVKESILKYNPDLNIGDLDNIEKLKDYLINKLNGKLENNWGLGKIQIEIFEKTVEEQLFQPTFITEYPTEVSPLARCNDENPFVTDRFELFIAGREIANGFSELNDPEDQAMRFKKQVEAKGAGDLEAMQYDADYIRALEYGMPPTAGEGIGIDRLAMLFTDSPSIRDVLLFPHMRAESQIG